MYKDFHNYNNQFQPLIYNNPFRQRLLPGWFEGNLIHFIDLGELDFKPSNLNNVYIFIRGFDIEGTPIMFPYQFHIFDSTPSSDKYSPFKNVFLVQVDETYSPNTITHVDEIKKRNIKIIETDMILNLPIV